MALGILMLLPAPVPGRAGTPAPAKEDLEFFERRVRPVLVERCYPCHSHESPKLKGHLYLDSREGMLKGGDTRPAIVPGEPAASLLVEAIHYGNPDLQMPPKGKLPEAIIADLTEWVKRGAPWPAGGPAPMASPRKEFDLASRRRAHWAWQPITPSSPPPVKNPDWCAQPTDQFILARLEQAGLSPAPPADRRTLIRRLYFDLTGLPPLPEAAEAFVADRRPDAYERLVDELLASPRYGERWARHWLDLVRYAETLGHEFDYPRHNAWRYRDYVIRAFNADVPYDQFVLEHIAGDLLPEPRRHPVEGFDESLIGTAFYWLGQQAHSPVDVRQHQADLIENQIDVLGKTFLGLTLACARCHDHKFDAISTRDFYALHGMLASSRYTQRAVDGPQIAPAQADELRRLKHDLRPLIGRKWLGQTNRLESFISAALEFCRRQPAATNTAEAASAARLDPALFARWVRFLREAPRDDPAHAAYPLGLLATTNPAPQALAAAWRRLAEGRTAGQTRASDPATCWADFTPGAPADWRSEGDAFSEAGSRPGDFVPGGAEQPVAAIVTEPGLHTGLLSRRLQGVLRSPTFTITNRFIHVRAAGRDTRVNVVIRNYTLIRDPIYGSLKRVLERDEPAWLTIDVERWRGEPAYLEFSDLEVPDPAADGGSGANGYLAVTAVMFADQPQPPAAPWLDWLELLGPTAPADAPALAARFAWASADAIRAWADADGEKRPSVPQARLLNALLTAGLLEWPPPPPGAVEGLLGRYRQVEASLEEPRFVPAMADGNGVDEHVFIRGNPRLPGEVVQRRFLEALGGLAQPPFGPESGRLEFARQLVDPSNPLLGRVMVNRVWLHLFGRGIVPTPDDFGVLGQPPSHPELLDWLAGRFRATDHGSVKSLIRLLVTSSAYRMSSRPEDPRAEQQDPENALLHRMPLRRLEGEAIRDALLLVSGRLDETRFGPSVPTHLTEFMDGRGRPSSSGPPDGAGRRSIYLEVRNNFLSPMMRTFDTPVPFTTVGQRTISNVPAQALILLNDPFILSQARLWAHRLLAARDAPPGELVGEAYRQAFARPATAAELAAALEFLERQARAYGQADTARARPEQVWTDLCHVLLNTKEFVHVN